MEKKEELTQDEVEGILKKMRWLIDEGLYTFEYLSTHEENPKNYVFLDDYRFSSDERAQTAKLLASTDYCGFIPNSTDKDLPDGTKLYYFVMNGYVTMNHTFSLTKSPGAIKTDIYVKFVFYPAPKGDVLNIISFHDPDFPPRYKFR